MRSRTAVGVLAFCWFALTVVGCGGSNGESTTTATTEGTETDTTAFSDARVTSFEIGELRCGGAVTAPVDVTWATEGATAVKIVVDNFTSVTLGTSGTRATLVPCDDNPHQISITPVGVAGPGKTETKEVAD